jgi:hypothetical protein
LAERIELVVLLLLGNGRELDGGYLVETLLKNDISPCHYLSSLLQTFSVVKAVLQQRNLDESGEIYFDVSILQNVSDALMTLSMSSKFSPDASEPSPPLLRHI